MRFANTPGVEENTETPEEFSAFGGWDLLRMVLVLMMVVVAVYGVVAFLRRRVPGNDAVDDQSPIKILATQPLGAGKDLHAVMIGRQVLVIGSGDGAIQVLTTVEDKETIDELILAHSRKAPPPKTFGGMLSRWASHAAVPGSGAEGAAGSPSGGSSTASAARTFLSGQRERLRQMR